MKRVSSLLLGAVFVLSIGVHNVRGQGAAQETPTPANSTEAKGATRPAPGMDPFTKDVIDAASKIGGVVSVLVAIFLAYYQVKKNRDERGRQFNKEREQKEKEIEEGKRNREQREEELRWRKASLARDMLNEMWDDSYANNAMLMLDWSNREYNIGKDQVERIARAEMWEALRTHPTNFNAKEKYVRDCFDHFFGFMQILEHYISIGLIMFDDVKYPFGYFAGKLNWKRDVVEAFLTKYEYDKAKEFLQRFESWNST
jgi:hypothetical protein